MLVSLKFAPATADLHTSSTDPGSSQTMRTQRLGGLGTLSAITRTMGLSSRTMGRGNLTATDPWKLENFDEYASPHCGK